MNPVLDTLRTDHANFAKLLDFMSAQARSAAAGGQADLEALVEAVEYLGDYPTRFHHPLENAIYESLKRARPAARSQADRLQHDHVEQGRRLAQFRKLIFSAREGREVALADFVSAVDQFVMAERQHMESEDKELFPAAAAVLGPKDWARIRERAAVGRDPLFGPAPKASLGWLHRILVEEKGGGPTT